MSQFVSDYTTLPHNQAGRERLDLPSFHRNLNPIQSVLIPLLSGRSGNVVEVGSGTGQHVAAFAVACPHLIWWPTDPNAAHRDSIAAWSGPATQPNIRPPTELDASSSEWSGCLSASAPLDDLAAILAINVFHIAPFSVVLGVFNAARRHLKAGGVVVSYGPYQQAGGHTTSSNEDFDRSLRHENPEWGVRSIETLNEQAAKCDLALSAIHPMPANNFCLVFQNQAETAR